MSPVKDENDIVYDQYGLDIAGIIRYIFDSLTGNDASSFIGVLERIWNVYSIIAILLSLLFFIGFVYAKIRYSQLVEIEDEAIRQAEERWARERIGVDSTNPRWEAIQKGVAGNSPEAWRIAIIEADILLEETLTNAGYVGQGVGEKLKTANTHSFTTLDDAWEAHKVRNEIAHAGSDFILTKKIAQDTLTRYSRVFREFGII